MQGLALARSYWLAQREQLLAPFADYRPRIAAGLVGFGSECFGFDDAHSRDHDFGPGFCLWLTEADHAAIGAALQARYDAMPKAFAGIPPRVETPRSGQRVGVFPLAGFYAQFLGAPELPVSDADWLQIPESLLASAVNGEVFADPLGDFCAIRARLLAYYPERVMRRKLAQAVARMAQSGQYNLPRALARGEPVAAMLEQAEFIRHTCLALHVLNRRYAPIQKWLHRSLASLPLLGHTLQAPLARLARSPAQDAPPLVEALCAQLLQTLVALGLTRPGDSFLEAHVDTLLGSAA